MENTQPRREASWFGLRPEVVDDVIAIFILLISIYLFLSLATHTAAGNLMGAFGEGVYNVLTYVFGRYVAYIPVLLMTLWGISYWRRRPWRHEPLRVAGGFFAIVFLCTLLAIPYADSSFSREEDFRVGGALGNFFVHDQCLALRNLLGIGGCYLFFTTLLATSLIIAFNISIRQLLSTCWKMITARLGFQDVGTDKDIVTQTSKPAFSLGRSSEKKPRTLAILEEEEEDEKLERVATDDELSPSPLHRLSRLWGQRRSPEEQESEGDTSNAEDDSSCPTEVSGSTTPVASAPLQETLQTEVSSPQPALAVGEAPHAPALEGENADDLLSPILQETTSQASQSETPTFPKRYVPPPITIFQEPQRISDSASDQEMAELAEILQQTLAHFDVAVKVTNIERGPTVSRIEVEPAPGVKISRITGLEADVARAMHAESVRIIAPVPGRGTVGFEIPNKRRRLVYLRDVIESPRFLDHESPLAIALGATTTGEPFVGDLAAMPHLLIAGTTGSGKSVCLNSIICSILFRMPPDAVKFIMIDPKRVELNIYRDIPHLLAPVVSDVKAASAALKWAVHEMEVRYGQLEELGVRNITAYNSLVRSESPNRRKLDRAYNYMPHIVIIIDELADLILVARNEVEDSIVRLAQMSRAVGMHLIIATQRPSVNVITGIIKANFPCRIAFKVAQKIDSRTILDCNGAEALLGRGDMLYSPGGGQKPIRLQGCYASDAEVEKLANYLRQQQPPQYWKETFEEELEEEGEEDSGSKTTTRTADSLSVESQPGGTERQASRGNATQRADDDSDPIDETLLRQAIRIVLQYRSASTSLLQRKLRIGFARAGRLMDMMEERGIVGPSLGPKTRDILVDPEAYLQQLDEEDGCI